jgi:hypothetical protein
MAMELSHVVPWGRSRDEYTRMFALTANDLSKKILGCGDGPASFNAEMTAAGRSVISIDPIYTFNGAQIRQRFDESATIVMEQVRATPQNWVWRYHKSPDDLHRNRERAIELFLADYEAGLEQKRYRLDALPALNFPDTEFELALCSHFLFLYSELFDTAFHIASVKELCRVASDVRIFPILTLKQAISPHLAAVRDAAAAFGFDSIIEKVDYELQIGGNQMLRLFRR